MKKLFMFVLLVGLAVDIAAQTTKKQGTKTSKMSTPRPNVPVVAANAKKMAGNIKFVEYDLPNGLHVILHQDNATPLVATTVMYHVGSKNEKPGRSGFAHFFEHLLFEGSENIKRGEYSKIVKQNGGRLNANTSFDRTYYYEILPSNKLELGLYLESERLLHAKIEEEGVKTQREVVKEERRQRYETPPYGTFIPEIMKNTFKVHPYKIPPIGVMEDLNAAKIDEFREFYKDFYVPENAILSIAGDLDIENTKKLVTKYFGEIPKGSKAIYRPNIVEPAQTAEVRNVVYDANIQLPAVMMSHKIPAQGTKDFYALSMLNVLMTGGSSFRMNKEIIDKQQKAVAVGGIPFETEDPGLIILYGISNMGVAVDSLEKAMVVEIEKLKNEDISDSEFQKIVNKVESDFVDGNSSVAGIAENLANYKMYLGDANLINTEIDRYMAVTKADLKRVANKYLTKENRVVLHYLPKPKEEKK